MAKRSKRIYTKYSEELKKALLQDDIKFLKVYGDNDACVEYKRIEYAHLTNADRIRVMTDEELAEWGATLPCCPPGPDLEERCYPQNVCENTDFARKCWLDWLKQEI